MSPSSDSAILSKTARMSMTEGDGVESIDVSAHEPRRIPSKKWRELIKKEWEADPLRCPKCSREMRIVCSSNQEDVIERILHHLGLWQEEVRVHCGSDPPGETTLDPWLDDPFPDYDAEPVMALSATERPATPKCVSRTPCSAAPSPPAPVLDFRAHFGTHTAYNLSLCAHGNARFRLQTPGQCPGGPKAISYQSQRLT